MTKPLLIFGVHFLKVLHVGQVNAAAHHLLDSTAGLLQDGLDVSAALPCRGGDAVLDERAGGVGGDLSGHVDGGAGFDGLRVGACGWGAKVLV